MTTTLTLEILIALLAVACLALAHRAMYLASLNAPILREMEELRAKHESLAETLRTVRTERENDLRAAREELMEDLRGHFGWDYDRIDDIRNLIPPVCTRCGKQGVPYFLSVKGYPDGHVFVCPDRTTAPDPDDYFVDYGYDCDYPELVSRFVYDKERPEAGMCTPTTTEA
jgi:hypothetical protein